MNVGGLVKGKYYKMELFFMERAGGQAITIKYKKTGSYMKDF